jgi:cytosine/adenosine deaminase-related metal-dependent hydrolase
MPRIRADLELSRHLKIRTTTHVGTGIAGPYAPELFNREKLLGPDLTFIHCNPFSLDDFKLMADHGVSVSSSPEVEKLMFTSRPDSPLALMIASGLKPTVSVDTVAITSGDLLTQLRFVSAQRLLPAPFGTWATTSRDALAYVTTNAAASLGMSEQIGSLTPGKQADLIMINTEQLNMFSPNSANEITWAHAGNIDTVMVAGHIVKRDGKLITDVDLDELRHSARLATKRILG